jgi:hypothetical protein
MLSFLACELYAQPDRKSPGLSIAFTNADLSIVLQVYSECAGRTLLQHQALPTGSKFNLNKQPATPEEARKLIEAALLEKGIATIPDGDKFIMVVPQTVVPLVKPAAPKPPFSGDTLPPGTMDMRGATMWRVLGLYADLVGKKLEPLDQLQWTEAVNLKTVTPISKTEAIYILKTIFAWRGIDVVPAAEGSIKAVRVYRE